MNTPQIRILLLFLALLGVQTPLPMQARGTALASKQEEAKKRAAQNEAARRTAAARSRQAPQSRPASPNRNPLTGSQPRPATNRPNPKPAAKPKSATPPANRPAPKAPANAGNRAAPKAPANNQANRPASKAPANAANRPAPKAPANNQANRPHPRPPAPAANRPAPKPQVVANRTGQKAVVANRSARPAFVPGKVTYPGKVTRPNPRPAAKRPPRPANRATNPRTLNQVIASNSNVNSNNRATNVTSVNNTTNNRVTNIGNTTTHNRVTNVSHNTYVNNNWGNQWTNNRTSVWNRNRAVNNRPVVINQNFQRSQNYAYRPASWGGRPWWSSSTYHNWHHGSWNYGWNRQWNRYHTRPAYRPPAYYPPGYHYHRHDHSSAGSAVAWGLAAWTLGSLAFDTGYNSYRNPYPAPPVQTRTTVINYTQPLSVVAAKEAPEPEEAALTSEEKSTAAIERARAEFRNGDYLAALKSTDESISYTPGDSTLHEFRALCLFALGRYGDAAGVLNPVLASGPGWDWATMANFYPDSETYTGQIRKLEAYVESKPDSADAHFLLGYHYMVAGFIDEAHGMFDTVTRLQPADTVAAQLRNLAESSSPNAEDEEAPEAESLTGTPEPAEGVVVEPIDPSDIEGSWKAASADGKAIVLALDPAGTFTWNYEGASDGKVLTGDWSIDEEGRLVLAADDVQMVADISLIENTLQFVLAGSPVGDPGLSFVRQ